MSVRNSIFLTAVRAIPPKIATIGFQIPRPWNLFATAVAGDLRAVVRERVDQGVDVVKVMASGGFATPDSDQLGAQFSASELEVLVEEAHRACA